MHTPMEFKLAQDLGFVYAEKSPHWSAQLKPMGATNRWQAGHVQPTDALPVDQLTIRVFELK